MWQPFTVLVGNVNTVFCPEAKRSTGCSMLSGDSVRQTDVGLGCLFFFLRIVLSTLVG